MHHPQPSPAERHRGVTVGPGKKAACPDFELGRSDVRLTLISTSIHTSDLGKKVLTNAAPSYFGTRVILLSGAIAPAFCADSSRRGL